MPEAQAPLVPQPLVARGPHLYFYDPTYQLDPNVEAEFFGYVFPTFGPMTAGLAQQQQVVIQANTAFEMREIVYFFNLANATFTDATRNIPNITIQLQDSGSGKFFFSAAAPLDSVASLGTSRRRALLWPKIFAPNSTVTVTLTNFDAAVATGLVRVTLLGRHLYRLAR